MSVSCRRLAESSGRHDVVYKWWAVPTLRVRSTTCRFWWAMRALRHLPLTAHCKGK